MGHCSASFLLLSLLLLSGTSCLHTVTFGFCNADPNVGCMDIERKALLKLREGLSDPSDRLSSWGGVDCCNWRGIGCNKTTGRVESLNLRNPYAEGLDSDGDDGTLHALGGKIPTSNQFNSLVDPSIYQGNAGLCGDPLPTPCQDNEETPQVPSEDREGDDDKSEKVWLMISTAIGFIVGFWVVFGSLVIKKTWRYAYFRFLDRMKYALLDFISAIGKCFCKRSEGISA